MQWIKLKSDGVVPRYICSKCGVLLLTVEGFALPEKCKACGAVADGNNPSVVVDDTSPCTGEACGGDGG